MLRSERSDALLDAEFGEALLLEVVAEHVAQLGRGGVIAILVRPGVARIEDLAVDARAGFRHFQLEDRLRLGLDAIELAVQCGIEQRSEEHTSELQSLMRISYAVFCLTKNTTYHITYSHR